MNFIIEDFDSKYMNPTDFAEALKRAKALADNMLVIFDICGDTEEAWNVNYDIKCLGHNYADEFTIIRTKQGSIQQTFDIEILTAQSAERNEKEEIAGGCVIGVDSTDNYKLGETVQTYTQIGDTNYWYREL